MIELTMDGPPVPASRPKFYNGVAVTPKEYRQYKQALINALIEEYPEIRDQTLALQRLSAYHRRKKQKRYKLTGQLWLPHDKGDWDNYGKTIGDALEQAGMLTNDRLIDDGHIQKSFGSDNPRVYLRLEEVS